MVKHRLVFFILLSFCLSCVVAREHVSGDATRRVRDATVMVCVEYGEYPNEDVSWGSGMVIGPGLVVTNAHVVNEKVPTRIYIHNDILPKTPANVVALRYDGNEYTNSAVVEYIANKLIADSGIEGLTVSAKQKNNDMAILSFTPPGGLRLPALAFNRMVMPRERIVAAGYPGQTGFSSSGAYGSLSPQQTPLVLTDGVVTSVLDNDPRMIVHNAQCSTGNSGGPVVNSRGEVLGMQTWTTVPGSAGGYMSLAISSPDIVAFLESNGIRPTVGGRGAAPRVPEQDYDARPSVLRAADAGDPDFMALSGLLFHMGIRGFPRDDDAAAHYLMQALRIAPNAPNAYLYKAGLAAVLIRSPKFRRPEQADQLLRSANNSAALSENSVHPDLHLLAFEAGLRLQGLAGGFAPDADRSLKLAEKAMEGGFALPFALTGYHYYFGDAYGGRDHAKALRHAREAARNGIVEGVSLLAHLYYDSEVIRRSGENLRIARGLAEEAVALGDPWGYGLLANMRYDAGERDGAREFAMTALRYGNRMAAYCLGRMAWDGFLANRGDFAQAARAWALVDYAERQGVRVALPDGAGRNAVVRTAQDILGFIPPGEQQWFLQEGRRERENLFR